MFTFLALSAFLALAAAAPRNDPQCIFGDKATWCSSIESSRCYYDADVCCGTCARFVRIDLPAAIVDSCRYGDRVAASICAADLNEPSKCYQDQENCCGTCAQVCLDIPGCEYGDKAGWCSGIRAEECYESSTAETCCKTCADFRRGPDACMFGDLMAGCSTSDCADATRAGSCCETCMLNVAALTAKNSMGQCLRQDEYWCAAIDPKDCYNHYYSCCNTCSQMYKYPGCEYGDQYEWCAPEDCKDTRLRSKCCRTCGVNNLQSCRNEASYCTNLSGTYCYDGTTRATCCLRCSDLKKGPPGCEYGDKAAWCANSKPHQCMDPNYAKTCCRICAELLTGPIACEFGDDMYQCQEVDCSDPLMRRKCCRTCDGYTFAQPILMPQEVTAPETIVGKTPVLTKTLVSGKSATIGANSQATFIIRPSNMVALEQEIATATDDANEPGCEDKASWCYNVKPHECYYRSTLYSCCKTCSMYYKPAALSGDGCQYGDKYTWCGVEYCTSPETVKACCGSCGMAIIGNAVVQPSVNVPESCKNTADWCTGGFHSAYCYNEETRSSTCCNACASVYTGAAGCEYGDKKTWCDNVPFSQCTLPDVQQNCCNKCRNYQP